MYIYPHRKTSRFPTLIAALAFLLIAAALAAVVWLGAPSELRAALSFILTPTPTVMLETPTPTDDPNVTPTPTIHPTHTPRPTKTPRPSPTLVPTATPVSLVEHFVLGRPVPLDATRIIPDWTYLYGTTQHGDQVVHHGEEFVNPAGTAVLAAADGEVVTAGSDEEPLCGPDGKTVCGERLNYYGNVVVIQLNSPYQGQQVYILYGHLKSFTVRVGQAVRAGEVIGSVGSTGVAEGPHVHFEVRLGANDYAHTRNPVLWMRPLAGKGALAGRVIDRNGKPIYSTNVFLYLDNETQDYVQDTETYGRDEHPAINVDDVLQENWAIPDVRAGKYLVRVQIGGLSYLRHVTVQEGRLTFTVFGGP